MNKIDIVVDEKKCTGCSACYSVCPTKCIKMVKFDDGFLNACIESENCVNCLKCTLVCPVFSKKTIGQINEDKKAVAVVNKDKVIVNKSSSGGFFYMLSKYMIEAGGLVCGAVLERNHVRHVVTDNIKDVNLMIGSKYVQSDLYDCFNVIRHALKEGKKVLFSGTPCQVHGINLFLDIEEKRQLITAEVVCRSVPSPYIFDLYCEELEKEYDDKIQSFTFRNKDIDWLHSKIKVCFNHSKFEEINYENSYMKLFYSNLISRNSCNHCPSKNFRSGSDFTLGDFWTVKNRVPSMYNEKGVSLVLLNSANAKHIFENIQDSFIFKETDMEGILQDSIYLYKSISGNCKRDELFAYAENHSFNQIADCFLRENMIQRIAKRIRSIWKK